MKFEEMSGSELLKYYINYVKDFKIDPKAPVQAKEAYKEALRRGQKKLEL